MEIVTLREVVGNHRDTEATEKFSLCVSVVKTNED